MELAFEQKQRSCLKRTAHLSLAQEQTQELIIPDAMPDAARTLICYAEPELQSKTSRAGSLLVTGNLRASCLYADEAGGLQLLTTDVPFTLKLESSDLQELTQSVVRCSVRSADSRLINSRKVLLRISVLVQADGYEPWTEEVRALTDAPACLQQKTQSYSNAVPVETAERAFQVSEELNVPEGRAKIVRLADCMLQPVVTEQNLVGSKAVMKGTANLQLTYLDEQNELRTLSLAVPFSQYCQLQGDYEQNEDVETALLVTGVQLEPVDTETSRSAPSSSRRRSRSARTPIPPAAISSPSGRSRNTACASTCRPCASPSVRPSRRRRPPCSTAASIQTRWRSSARQTA